MGIRLIRVLTRLGAGGPPIHCLTATREMAKVGYETTLVAGRCGPHDGDMSYLVRDDDRIVSLNSLTPLATISEDVRSFVALWRMFRRERPQIVHTHTARAGAVGRLAAWLAGVPVIVHTYHGHVMRGYFSPGKTRLIVWVERLLALLTDAVFVLSPRQAKEMVSDIHLAGPDKVRVVPLGMDLEFLQSLPPAPHDGQIVVGWFGRLVPIKSVPLLVDVIDRVLDAEPRIHFVIAGDGPDRPILENALPRWGSRVEYLGWVEATAPVIQRCHFLLQTSRNEGTPVSLIQGMAAGRPFVATAVGGVPDLAYGQRHGLVRSCKPDELAKGVIMLAQNPLIRERMGAAAAQFARERHSTEKLVAQLDSLYRALLAERTA